MNRFFKILTLSWCFLLISGSAKSEIVNNDTLKVLFVGNSYTYFWNLPQTIEAMATNQGVPVKARQSTAGGADWKEHWEGEKELETRRLIQDGDWDVVILQNHSLSTVNKMDEFMEYGSKLIELVKSEGATPVLYQTWAREFNPLMIDEIIKGYHKLASSYDLEVVKAGEVWKMTRELRPGLKLYDPDGSHPSHIGTYLTACLFFSHLTGESPEPLNKRIRVQDANGEKLYLTILSQEDADFLQDVVMTFKEQQER